jgi:hypothetical protein
MGDSVFFAQNQQFTLAANTIWAVRVQAPRSGTIDVSYLFVDGSGWFAGQILGIEIYADNGIGSGLPAAALGGNTVGIAPVNGWAPVTMSVAGITSGNFYWIAWQSPNPLGFWVNTQGSFVKLATKTSEDGTTFPNPFGTPTATANTDVNIYSHIC